MSVVSAALGAHRDGDAGVAGLLTERQRHELPELNRPAARMRRCTRLREITPPSPSRSSASTRRDP
jgi:hypothetical protein